MQHDTGSQCVSGQRYGISDPPSTASRCFTGSETGTHCLFQEVGEADEVMYFADYVGENGKDGAARWEQGITPKIARFYFSATGEEGEQSYQALG